MATTTYNFYNWVSNYTYSKWDVVQGVASNDSRYYYSLVDGNAGNKPAALTGTVGYFTFAATSSTRIDDINRMYFTQTGSTNPQPGSIVEIRNISPDSSTNYSGVCIAAGSGYIDYLNPGLNVTNSVSAGTVHFPMHPYWTTGFAWIPGWTTSVTHNQSVMTASMGEGYSQRQSSAINVNSLRWNLAFTERTDKEARALLNFFQEKGGVGTFCIPFPVGLLYNNPNLRFINGPASHTLNSYGLNDVTVEVMQVFDI